MLFAPSASRQIQRNIHVVIASSDSRVRGVVSAYVHARERVIRSGYLKEIQWQNSKQLSATTEACFLEQFAWVALSSGMRESVVRSRFSDIRSAFGGFQSALDIVENAAAYSSRALTFFKNKPKINSVVAAAEYVSTNGYAHVIESLTKQGPSSLTKLPFMGPATSLHLAKNLGMDVAKPDRHLLRIAALVGYSSVQELCGDIASYVGDRIAVVDLVFWRYATLSTTYLDDLIHFLVPQANATCSD
jgi:hypothetical protein